MNDNFDRFRPPTRNDYEDFDPDEEAESRAEWADRENDMRKTERED